MTKLKLKVVMFEKKLAVQILEMDEQTRRRNNYQPPQYQARNGFHIRSEAHPDLNEDKSVNAFYLRGTSKSDDLRLCIKFFETNAEMEGYVKRLRAALEEWSKEAMLFRPCAIERDKDIWLFE